MTRTKPLPTASCRADLLLARVARRPMSRLLFATAALCAAAGTSAADSVPALRRAVPALCRQLQEQGWHAPADIVNPRNKPVAEINIPGVMYLCTLEQALDGEGPGRPPDLQALLSDDGKQTSMIFSANLWCEADRTAALDALTARIGRLLQQAELPLPADIATGLRAGRAATAAWQGITFSTTPIAVDADACAKVGPGGLGAVLFKIDLSIKTAG